MVIFHLNQASPSEETNKRIKVAFDNGVKIYYPVRFGCLLVESLIALQARERIALNQLGGVYKRLDMVVDIFN